MITVNDKKILEIVSESLEGVKVGVIFLDPSLRIKLINKYAAFIFGVSCHEIIDQPLENLHVSKDVLDFLLNPQQKTRKKYFTIKESNIRMVVSYLEWEGQVLGNYIFLEDITETIKTLHQLEELKRRNYYFAQALESAFGDAIIFDQECKIVYMSQSTAYKVGVEQEKVVGLPITALDPKCTLKDIIEEGNWYVGNIWNYRKHSIPSSIVPIYNKEGSEVEGVLWKGIYRELEEVKKINNKYCTDEEINFLKHNKTKVNFSKQKKDINMGIKYTFQDIIGNSEAMKKTKKIAHQAAKVNSSVLLLGESGTGKELLAHAIHSASSRRKGPFIIVNCAAIPETLLESELFGYSKGAFSGALKDGKPGKFELAHKGTIFLDEIGDMGFNMQAKLLRVLQEREVERVGGVSTMKVDVRVIAATNQDLYKKVKENTFRGDLFYRINVVPIVLPPLRERKGDLPLFVNYFLNKLNIKLGTNIIGISNEVASIFELYSWPGNVRELENTMEGAMCLCTGKVITVEHLPSNFVQRSIENSINVPTPNFSFLEGKIQEIEKEAIKKALEKTQGNKKKAALLLGLPRSSFYNKLKQYDIT